MTEHLDHDTMQQEPEAVENQERSKFDETKPDGAPVSSEEVEHPEGDVEMCDVIVTSVKDAGCGVCDTACKCSVSGSRWYFDYKKGCIDVGLREFIREENESERFRFGDGALSGPLSQR